MPAKPRPALLPRFLLAVLALLVLLGAGHALLWRWMAGQVEANLAAWEAARRAEGWIVEHDAPVRAGWPLAVRLGLPAFRLAREGVDWRAASIELRIALAQPGRLVVDMAGEHRLRLGQGDWPVQAGALSASLPVERRALPSEAAIRGAGLRLGGIGVAALRLDLETREGALEGEPALALRGRLDEVELPVALAALGPRIEGLALDTVLTGPMPPPATLAARATGWRDGGGTLALRRLDLRWGPVTAALDATLALDQALQPMGAGTLRLTGAEAALDALAAAGMLAPRGAAGARVMAGLLGRVPPEGGPPRIEVPLTLDRQRLTLAGLPLARIETWRWP